MKRNLLIVTIINSDCSKKLETAAKSTNVNLMAWKFTPQKYTKSTLTWVKTYKKKILNQFYPNISWLKHFNTQILWNILHWLGKIWKFRLLWSSLKAYRFHSMQKIYSWGSLRIWIILRILEGKFYPVLNTFTRKI